MKTPQKLLKSSKDLGFQYIDFLQMFEKKLKQPHLNPHLRSQVLQQYRNQIIKFQPLSIMESDDLIVYGGFENSNIHAVSQEGLELNVLLSSDTNTNGCTQWFYFGIKVKTPLVLKIRILNNRRSKSLLNKYNHIHVQENGEWQTECTTDVFYYKTNINHPFYHSNDKQIADLQANFPLYTLEFTYDFKQCDSIVYFSLAMPYTVRNLYKFLNTCTLKKKSLCQTQLGLPIYQLKTQNKEQKEIIVILARQHPSETVGSWVCQEIINLLQSGHQILDKYRFIIFPMMNPDGVFMGNSRCNFNGVDLNRKWDVPNQCIEPEVYYVQKALKKYQISFLIDLHGHSRKLNQFIYGCSGQINHISEYINAKHFSKLLSQENEMFNYKDCAFCITPDRITTARVAMFKKLKIPNSMTIETSLYGYCNGKDQAFKVRDFQKMANCLLNALYKFDVAPRDQAFYEPQEIQRVNHILKKSTYEEKDSESDSEAEQDIIIHKPRLKSRRDSTPGIKIHHPVKSKPKQSETPQLNQQTSLFFKQDQAPVFGFRKMATNSSKRIQMAQLHKMRSRMNSFQSQTVEDPSPLPSIHHNRTKNIKGALDLIQAIQIKALFK